MRALNFYPSILSAPTREAFFLLFAAHSCDHICRRYTKKPWLRSARSWKASQSGGGGDFVQLGIPTIFEGIIEAILAIFKVPCESRGKKMQNSTAVEKARNVQNSALLIPHIAGRRSGQERRYFMNFFPLFRHSLQFPQAGGTGAVLGVPPHRQPQRYGEDDEAEDCAGEA